MCRTGAALQIPLKHHDLMKATMTLSANATRTQHSLITVQQHILQEQKRFPGASGEFSWLLSGITLAQVGLGSVHGLASPLGAFFPIPHGVVCGTLLATATEINIRNQQPDHPALGKYAELGTLLSGKASATNEVAETTLVELLHDWTTRLALPRLRDYGVTRDDFPRIIANCRGNSMKTNPIVISDEEVHAILSQRL